MILTSDDGHIVFGLHLFHHHLSVYFRWTIDSCDAIGRATSKDLKSNSFHRFSSSMSQSLVPQKEFWKSLFMHHIERHAETLNKGYGRRKVGLIFLKSSKLFFDAKVIFGELR